MARARREAADATQTGTPPKSAPASGAGGRRSGRGQAPGPAPKRRAAGGTAAPKAQSAGGAPPRTPRAPKAADTTVPPDRTPTDRTPTGPVAEAVSSTVHSSNGLGLAALVLGICSVLLCWTVFVAMALGAVAAVLGYLGWRRVRRGAATNGMTTIAGMATGLLGLLIGVVLLSVGLTTMNSDAGRSYQACVDAAGGDQAKILDCQRQFHEDLSG